MDRPPSTQGVELATSGELLWGVGAVAARLGIAGPTLRTWDRRYGLGPSRRTEGGHRRYTETDVARVDLMRRLIDEGVPTAQAATVAVSSEAAALHPRKRQSLDATPVRRPGRVAASSTTALIRAAADLDAATLSRISAQVLRRHGAVSGWTRVFVPALREVGHRWSTGEVGVEVEHLMSERVGAELRAVTRQHRVHRAVPAKVLMASAEDEQHHLALLALEAALAERRIASVTLGARTPPGPLEAAVERRDPTAVFVWATMPRTDNEVQLLDRLGDSGRRHVLLGGPGWEGVAVPATPLIRVHNLVSAVERIGALLRP